MWRLNFIRSQGPALLALVATCLSSEDVRKYQCEVACRLGGWDTGTYADKKCLCMDVMDYDALVGTALASVKLPRIKRVAPTNPSD